MICYRCGTEVPLTGKPGRQETCPHCTAYLHVCLNCDFYDPNAHNQCREPQAAWVSDKETGNFCDYFRPHAKTPHPAPSDRQQQARRKLEELFKKK